MKVKLYTSIQKNIAKQIIKAITTPLKYVYLSGFIQTLHFEWSQYITYKIQNTTDKKKVSFFILYRKNIKVVNALQLFIYSS